MQDIPVSSTRFLRDFCFEIFALRFSAALGNMSKLYCTRLHENSTALGNMSKFYCTRLYENSAALGNLSTLNCTCLHENFLVNS